MTTPAAAIHSKRFGRLYPALKSYPLTEAFITAANTPKQQQALIQAGYLVPSITNVCSIMNEDMSAYYEWATKHAYENGHNIYSSIKEHKRYMDKASEKGTIIHTLIEWYINEGYASQTTYGSQWTEHPNYSMWETQHPTIPNHMEAFHKFLEKYTPTFQTTEQTMLHPDLGDYGWAGTADFTATINGEKVIGDWKTGSELRKTVGLQLSALGSCPYIIGQDNHPQLKQHHTQTGIGVRLGGDSKLQVKRYNLSTHYETFKALRATWAYSKLNGNEVNLTDHGRFENVELYN